MKWNSFLRKIFLLFCILPLPFTTGAYDRDVQTRHEIRLRLFPVTNALEATDTITIKHPTETSLSFSLAPEVEVIGVQVNGLKQQFTASAGQIIIPLSHDIQTEDIQVSITYRGLFRDQVPTDPVNNEDPTYGVSSIISPQGVFLSGDSGWYPRYRFEKTSLFRIQIESPKGMSAVTTGKRIDSNETDQLTSSTWETEHPLTSPTLVAGNFSISEISLQHIPISTYFYPQQQGLSETYLDAAKEYLTLYESLFGPYPFSKFAIVENFFPTGYGFPSWTLLGSTVVQLPFIVKTSLGHEIAHSWWGNGIDVDMSMGNWAEGLTTYVADYLYKERQSPEEGKDYRIKILRDYATLVNPANEIPLSEFTSRHNKATQAVGYGKGAMVFHMLRRVVGETAFWQGLRDIARLKMYGQASWRDFQDEFSALTGKDLVPFFSQWLTRKGAPVLGIENISVKKTPQGWFIKGILTQTNPAYFLEIPAVVRTDVKEYRLKILSQGLSTAFDFLTNEPPLTLEIDPDADIFRHLSAEEIPPVINAIRGATDLLVVLSDASSAIYQQSLNRLLGGMGQTGKTIVKESDLSVELIGSHDILFFGQPHSKALKASLKSRADFFDSSFVINGARYNNADDAMFGVFDHPNDPAKVFAVFFANSSDAAAAAAGKIPHYGRYSYLTFSMGRNSSKGTWPITNSPLIHHFHTEKSSP